MRACSRSLPAIVPQEKPLGKLISLALELARAKRSVPRETRTGSIGAHPSSATKSSTIVCFQTN